MYKLNDRFGIEADANKWVLVERIMPNETFSTELRHERYYTTLSSLCKAIIDEESKRALESLPKDRVENKSNLDACVTMMEGIAKRLETFLENKI